jgi:adiponectin receptor
MLTIWPQISLLGLGCLVVSWFEHFRTPQWRPYRALMFIGLGMSGVVPILHALTRSGFADLHQRMGLGWVVLQGVLYIVGATFYAVSVSLLLAVRGYRTPTDRDAGPVP